MDYGFIGNRGRPRGYGNLGKDEFPFWKTFSSTKFDGVRNRIRTDTMELGQCVDEAGVFDPVKSLARTCMVVKEDCVLLGGPW